jgi:3-oxoacyl-[acyl-carrier-protein] synthase I
METKMDHMRRVWSVADGIVSSLGIGTEDNYNRVRNGESGIADYSFESSPDEKYKISSVRDQVQLDGLTRFESLCVVALEKSLAELQLDPTRTLFILSTTKGNIDLLQNRKGFENERLNLHATAKILAERFGFSNNIVVSNACISGVLALIIAKRFIQSGTYDHAVVVGADIISQFVVSGFNSLQALSPEICKPFDESRCGINLGEAAAVMVLTALPAEVKGKYRVALTGEGLSNDANHISGPSRTGEELALAIGHALGKSGLKRTDIDFISAHGTGTMYNDEMEAKAFFLAGLEGIPLNSLKSYYGHTLGAAGILESIISIRSLIQNEIIGTFGFQKRGVSMPVKVAAKTQPMPLKRVLKTASGFGGCNAALIFEKDN